jgi:hypothetical protein
MSSIYLTPLLLSLPLAHAAPLMKRTSEGAKAGMGIGIAVAVILVILVVAFLIVHFRRSRHIAAINRERAILAGEKNADGSDKFDKFAPEPAPQKNGNGGLQVPGGGIKRNKSVKDRLMGPLYRGSTIDLMPIPKARVQGDGYRDSKRMSTMTLDTDGVNLVKKPWADGENSPRPSFSSKRATRMMMMM